VVKFYTIIDLSRRKNISATLRAFHLAFPPEYPVALIIKVGKIGADPHQLFDYINNITIKNKQSLRLYKNIEDYHNEIVLTEHVTDDVIQRIHQTCDCYVSSAFAEGFSIPCFEAMAYGNTVIGPAQGGPNDYLLKYKIGGVQEPVFGMEDTLDNLFTGREDWFSINTRELADAMRKAYHDIRPDISNIEQSRRFSYENIGLQIKEYLCESQT
jgi:glycosyltransferase involved in cell wall biosynthesis